MFTPKSQIVLFLTLSLAASTACKTPHKNSLRRNTAQLTQTTVGHAYGALCSVARGADHLFYPALCTLAGKYTYDTVLAPRLSADLLTQTDLEKNIPGTNTARNVLLYAIIGGLVCATCNYASNFVPVNDFIQTNMPHISALLQHINTELSGEFVSPRPQKQNR